MTKEQVDLLLEQVRDSYSQETVKDTLQSLGYDVSIKYKFKLREGERTASASINKNGLIKDFGGGGGDIIKIMQEYHAFTFVDALKYIADQIGLRYPEDDHQDDEFQRSLRIKEADRLRKKREEDQAEQEIQRLLDIEKEEAKARKTLAWYDSYREQLQTFKNEDYKSEALAIAPMFVFAQATKEALSNFKELTTYDHKNKTLVVKIADHSGEVFSYKRRRYTLPDDVEPLRWVTKSGTVVNEQTHISIPHSGDVYVIEGHHDMLTATLLQQSDVDSFNFIMVPTENYRSFNEYELKALENREIVFLMDVKKDAKELSAIPMTELSKSLPTTQSSTAVLVDFFLFLEWCEITPTEHKLDLSDVVRYFKKGGISGFLSSLKMYTDLLRSEAL